MATEESKAAQRLRLIELYVFSLAAAIWDFVGDSVLALRSKIGEEVLKMMEKEMGLQIAGETPADVLTEIGRLMVDEFGFCSAVEVQATGNTIVVKAKDSLEKPLSLQLAAMGVGQPFLNPIMNAGLAALKRMGVKAHAHSEIWEAGNGSIVTFVLV